MSKCGGIFNFFPPRSLHWPTHSFFFEFIAGQLEPYYDDEGEPIVDTDEIDSEEEIIMIGNKASRDYDYHD